MDPFSVLVGIWVGVVLTIAAVAIGFSLCP